MILLVLLGMEFASSDYKSALANPGRSLFRIVESDVQIRAIEWLQCSDLFPISPLAGFVSSQNP